MSSERPIPVSFFRLDSGREPTREWLRGLDQTAKRTIGQDVKMLQYGWPIGMPLARKMEADLWELRSTLPNGVARILFTLPVYAVGWAYRAAARLHQEVAKDTQRRLFACKATTHETEIHLMSRKNIGSSFDDFLGGEGLLEDATAVAVKRYIAYRLSQRIAERNLTKAEVARMMRTSRSALDRLLDPENSSVTLQTLQSAAQALGGKLSIELEF